MARRKAGSNKITVGNFTHVSGKVIIAGGDVYEGFTAEQVSVLLEQITSNYQRKPFDGRCPYKGLKFFEEEDAELFFGRERLVEDLLRRMKASRTVFITGPSGSGKSSLVRAGLIHALKQGAINTLHSERWLYETIGPGREPIKELSLTFSRLKGPDLADYFQAHANEMDVLHICAESVLSGRKDQRFVLFVDQFEEIFSPAIQEIERLIFINMLAQAGTVENGRVIVLFAMRSDFLSNCAAYPAVNELLSEQFRQIGAMQREELVSAIALPARQVGLPVEEELIAQIINDMKGEPGALPLMQFALKELFEAGQARGGRVALTLDDYLKREGIQKMLAHHADDTFNQLSPHQQELARSIFSGLIEIGRGRQDTRRTALFDELVPANTNPQEVEAVVQKLADARLIITDEQAGRDTVTISHERLINAWPWLEKLINENRDVIALQNEIASDAKEWDDQQRDPSYLYTGARLASARQKLDANKIVLGGLAQLFIETGVKADADALKSTTQRVTQLRRRSVYLTVALVASLAAISAAVFFQIKSRQQMDVALARRLITQAQSLRPNGESNGESNQIVAVLLAVESTRLSPSAEAQKILQTNSLAHEIIHMSHKAAVNSVAFSPDGKYVVSGSADKTARVWEVASGKEIAHLTHDGIVSSVVFSPDGKYVASAGCDEFADGCIKGSVRVWEAASGKQIARMNHGGYVNSVVFSHDGTYVASASDDKTARVWKATTGKEIARMPHDNLVASVAFSPDDRYVVTASSDEYAHIWEALTGKAILRLPHNGAVTSVAFSPDGKYVVSGGYDRAALLWDISAQKYITLLPHDDVVTSVAFSPDGKYVVSGAWDNTARVWSWTNLGASETARMEMGGPVEFVTFSPDSRYVMAGGCGNGDVKGCDAGIVLVWEARTGREIAHLIRKDKIASGSFSPDGKYIVSGSWDERVDLWEAIDHREIFRIAHKGYMNNTVFSPDSKYVVATSCDQISSNNRCTKTSIHIREVARGKEIAHILYDNYVYPVAFSSDSKYMMSTSCDEYVESCIKTSVRVWELATSREITRLTQKGNVSAVAFSADSKFMASGNCDEFDQRNHCVKGNTHVWEMTTGKEITLIPHPGNTNPLAISPDGKYVVWGTCDEYDQYICIQSSTHVWEVAAGREIVHLIDKGFLGVIAISPDSKYAAWAGENNTVRILEISSGKELAPLTHNDKVNKIAFSPDSSYIVSGSSDKTARVWEVPTGREIASMTHDSSVFFVAFRPDGKYIVSVSGDSTGIVWEASSGRKIAYINYTFGSPNSIAFSEDGNSVLTTTGDSVNEWLYRQQDLIEDACSTVARNLTRAEWKQYIGDALSYRPICPNLPIEPEPTSTP